MVSTRMDEEIKELIDQEENCPGVVGVEEEWNRRTKEAQCYKYSWFQLIFAQILLSSSSLLKSVDVETVVFWLLCLREWRNREGYAERLKMLTEWKWRGLRFCLWVHSEWMIVADESQWRVEYIEFELSNWIWKSLRSINRVWAQLHFSYVREKVC